MSRLEAKELRVGNWYKWYADGKYYYYQIEAKDFISDNITNFEPVELTEKWLLKIGYEKKSDWQFINEKLVIEIWIDEPIKLNVRFRINENESVLISQIKYLHQLQNLFFSLYGEELTIKQNDQ